MWYSPLERRCMLILGGRGCARYGRVHLTWSNESKLLMTIVLCSVILLTAYTQTGLFPTHTTVPQSVRLLRDVYVSGFENPIPDLCVENGTNVTVVIVVTSAPHNNDRRKAIRNTWASFPRHRNYHVAFIVGSHPDPVVMRPLTEESALHNDVIISRNADSYCNIILKTASILEWARTFCRNASYILKTDDDSFINVPKLKEFIKTTSKSENNIYGYVNVEGLPIRNFASKYYISEEDFSGPVFPDYVSGGGYLMTIEAARVLYEAALNLTYFNVEDVFFTGVVAQKVGVGRVAMPEFAHRQYSPNLKQCELNNTIVFQDVTVFDQYNIFSLLNNN